MWAMNYDSAANYWVEKDKESVAMKPEALFSRIEAFLSSHNTCALATASEDMVRCTPIEYNYLDGCFYLFSEGGLKFWALKENKRVGLAIFDSYEGFGKVRGLQVEGEAAMIEPFSEEYLKLMEHKKIPVEAMKKMEHPMNLIRITPMAYDYLDSALKDEGVGVRQHYEVKRE